MPPPFTVMVVEDDHLIRRMLDTVLRDNGYEVIVARDVLEIAGDRVESEVATGVDVAQPNRACRREPAAGRRERQQLGCGGHAHPAAPSRSMTSEWSPSSRTTSNPKRS